MSTNSETRRCTQVQCGYYLQGHCKNCEGCKSIPYVLNLACKRCTDCESVPGSLRWENSKDKPLEMAQEEPVNEIEILVEIKKVVEEEIKEQMKKVIEVRTK